MGESGDLGWQPKSAAELRGRGRGGKPDCGNGSSSDETVVAQTVPAKTPMSPAAELTVDAIGNILLATPLAGIAWLTHDGEIATAVFVIELCLLYSWKIGRFRASRRPLGHRVKAPRLRGFAAAALTGGLTTWCIAAAVNTQGTLEDSIQNAVFTGLGTGLGLFWLPTRLARASDESKAKRRAKREAAAGRKVRGER